MVKCMVKLDLLYLNRKRRITMKKEWNEKIESIVIFGLIIAFVLLVICSLLQMFNVNIVILACIAVGIIIISVLLLLFELIAIFIM